MTERRREDEDDSGRRSAKKRDMVVPVAAVGALLSSLGGLLGSHSSSNRVEEKLDVIGSRLMALEIKVAQNEDLRERLKDLESRLRQVEKIK